MKQWRHDVYRERIYLDQSFPPAFCGGLIEAVVNSCNDSPHGGHIPPCFLRGPH